MIQANELRIGNLFYPINRNNEIHLPINTPFVVAEILFSEVSAYKSDDKPHEKEFVKFRLSDICPIPLTPEILEKCGFVNDNKRLSRQMVLTWSFGKEFWVENNNGDTILEIKCEYLHQLQNLYFALTGEELEVNL